jgi:hypothetical protein
MSRSKINKTGLNIVALTRLHPSRLGILYLDESAVTEDSLKALSGATNLQVLSLKRVPLHPSVLPFFRTLPGLKVLELTGCGLLDEEVDVLAKSMPRVRFERM